MQSSRSCRVQFLPEAEPLDVLGTEKTLKAPTLLVRAQRVVSGLAKGRRRFPKIDESFGAAIGQASIDVRLMNHWPVPKLAGRGREYTAPKHPPGEIDDKRQIFDLWNLPGSRCRLGRADALRLALAALACQVHDCSSMVWELRVPQ